MSTAERIQSAAIRLRCTVYEGISHKVAVYAAALVIGVPASLVWEVLDPQNQGFTTTLGRFVSRAEAWEIAGRAGQIKRDVLLRRRAFVVVHELNSEDLGS